MNECAVSNQLFKLLQARHAEAELQFISLRQPLTKVVSREKVACLLISRESGNFIIVN